MKSLLNSFKDLLAPFDTERAWAPYITAAVIVFLIYVSPADYYIEVILGASLVLTYILGSMGILTAVVSIFDKEVSFAMAVAYILIASVVFAIFITTFESPKMLKALLDTMYLGILFHFLRDNLVGFS